MSTTVHVQNISPKTSEQEVRDFFSFCGKINSLSVTPTSDEADATKSASVTFEKDTAAKTALLLDNTQLGPAQVHVTSAAKLEDLAGKPGSPTDVSQDEIPQEDKPRSRIVAEYLAHGYVISDKAIERALDLDKQHGLSTRFTTALTNFDNKFKASERAQAVDQKYGISSQAQAGWRSLSSYYDKAMGTPSGQKLRQFYEETNKQVQDVHNEARHLANLRTGKGANEPEKIPGTDKTKCNCGADTANCACVPGTCACANCAKNPETAPTADAEKANMEKVGDTDRTQCNCGADTGKCSCAPGKCSCARCAKNPDGSHVQA